MSRHAIGALLFAAAALFGPSAGLAGNDHPEKEPGPKTKGEVYTWKASDGLAYEYFVPKDYDPAKGANLLLMLHGSNLDRRWSFANHEAGKFRPDDVVVSPDGTTSNGKNGFNFLQSEKDLQRLHALHEELKKKFKVNATFVYGHSQGSFFTFLYAGAYPDDVQGVVGQSSGVWIGTQATAKHHHQAVALMHGTADPVVPYAQSVGGLDFYRQAKYPMVHLRSLEGWNHWPNQDQTAQELAWCEGMTTTDPARLAASFATLAGTDAGEGWGRDYAALHAVSRRVLATETAPEDLKTRATKCVQDVEALAAKHVEAIAKSLGKGKGEKLEDAAWVGHLPPFLRDFDGIACCDTMEKEWEERFAKQKADAVKALREYYRVRKNDPAKAFSAGVEAVREGFLWCECSDPDFLKSLETWRADGKLKLAKADTKSFDDVLPTFNAARKKGLQEYASLNKK
jgi:predicted esterase